MARHPLPTKLTSLSPLPLRSPRNAVNAGNSCYLDAVLFALYAEYDACDGLLDNAPRDAAHAALHAALISFINTLRRGVVVSKSTVQDVRAALITLGWHRGKGQHDAAELFAFLLDELRAPFVPLYNNLRHDAAPDSGDHAPSTERLLWLDIPLDYPSLPRMLDDYFFKQVRHGLRRQDAHVDAVVTKSLIPFYTPVRETGETVSARRDRFRYLTVPLAINRFQMGGDRKSRQPVHVPTAMPAAEYVEPFGAGERYTLILRSAVCHLGASIRSGHYVAYTFEPSVGWRRWNDLDGGEVRSVRGDVSTGLPEDAYWREELQRDSYLLFYELVPGDGEIKLKGRKTRRARDVQIRADEQFAKQRQHEEDSSAAFGEHLLLNDGNLDLLGGGDDKGCRCENCTPCKCRKCRKCCASKGHRPCTWH